MVVIPKENLPDLPFMDLVPDVHDWYKFESELWDVGENIRQFLLENKNKLYNGPHVKTNPEKIIVNQIIPY